MKKEMFLVFTCFLFLSSKSISLPKVSSLEELRKGIGPVYTSPVTYKEKLYFLSSTGSLFEAPMDMSSVKSLFRTKLKTVSGVALDNGILYFGEGLHEDKKSNFYAFDIEKGKLLFTTPVKGHIEKTPLVINDLVITGIGPGGISAFDKVTGNEKWKLSEIDGKKLHVDSSPQLDSGRIFFSSIYDFKAIIAADPLMGKVIWKSETLKSPKADLQVFEGKIVAIATDGDLNSKSREIPADLLILESATGKSLFKEALRGTAFFPQLIDRGEVFLALSTGDIASVNLKTGKLTVIDQYAEPFMASPFKKGDHWCVVSIMGRLVCYKKMAKMKTETLEENVLGPIGKAINKKVFLPTRIGYRILE